MTRRIAEAMAKGDRAETALDALLLKVDALRERCEDGKQVAETMYMWIHRYWWI